MDPMSKAFIAAVERFVEQEQIPLITFAKGQRKDDVAKEYHAHFHGTEGIVFVGKAQEKTPVFRTEKRRNPETGQTYPWIVRSHGHGQPLLLLRRRRGLRPVLPQVLHLLPLQRQALHQRPRVRQAATGQGRDRLRGPGQRHPDAAPTPDGCSNSATACRPPRSTRCCASGWRGCPIRSPPRIAQAGYRYDVSILQAEFSLTQVLDRPLTGRVFFEEVIRENLDIGRPDQVQLIFERRVTKRTPGRFRTRVLTEGVTPSLHIDYKHSRIKQYHKEGRALRTETTINDTRDFGIGKRLSQPARLAADRLPGQPTSPGRPTDQPGLCRSAKTRSARSMNRSRSMGNGPAALRFADAAVQALFSALLVFRLLASGFFQPRSAGPLGSPAGEDARRHDPGPDDLSPAAAALARLDRADPRDPSLSGDETGLAHRACSAPAPIIGSCGPAWPRSFPRKLWTIPTCAEALTSSTQMIDRMDRESRRCRHET